MLGVSRGAVGGRGSVFMTEQLYYFIKVIIQTLHISSFILVYIDILHIVNIVSLDVLFPPPEKLHFGH